MSNEHIYRHKPVHNGDVREKPLKGLGERYEEPKEPKQMTPEEIADMFRQYHGIPLAIQAWEAEVLEDVVDWNTLMRTKFAAGFSWAVENSDWVVTDAEYPVTPNLQALTDHCQREYEKRKKEGRRAGWTLVDESF